ncbi:hypothetical protein TanjilG_01321 [Lupinus angustifolius]|uniref:Protein phosphatase 1 regulatory subunit 7 n=1 Tax=Lupinus angustifolius TaxID=3871 RepID=A0A4P1RFD0_LUPAN|nr:PREDICTED: leucine-rich repeat-containing protein 40 [Lupinus angustifolius]OIW09350.1 hypothetical protein TanjilG_01321 [Lupinus angustifolius]
MNRLSYEQVLKDNNVSGDSSSVVTLQLNYKALSDVSCLGNFTNLEKLDLKFNSLTSLEGLRSCINLKWLSVVENKLESLEGIQGLTKLTVLNAGKNKLKSMDQVSSLVSVRALILNENEITSICKLDQMKELNTLVLSKNPIGKIGDALMKVKSITKLSLSYCQLQRIDSSLKSCVELREVRLGHNEIKSLPDELIHNSKLQNLDLGNNVITRWSELKVLNSLTNLRNLNLQGNPVSAIDKVTRKIKKALPRLQIFNARPVDKDSKNEKGDVIDGDNDFLVDHEGQNLRDSSKEKKSVPKERKKDTPKVTIDPDVENNKSTTKKRRKDDKPLDKGLAAEENVNRIEKKPKTKQKNEEQSELDLIDDAEASFMDIFKIEKGAENLSHGGEMKAHEKAIKDVKSVSGAVTSFAKRKSAKLQNTESLSNPSSEIGIGGPSTWGDD